MDVEIIHPDEWFRLRSIRLKSLTVNPEAFGGTLEVESAEDESAWREKFAQLDFLIASVDGVDAAVMSVEKLDGDYGATCWIGGCWSNPDFRGVGLMRAMFEFLDKQADSRDLSCLSEEARSRSRASRSGYRESPDVVSAVPECAVDSTRTEHNRRTSSFDRVRCAPGRRSFRRAGARAARESRQDRNRLALFAQRLRHKPRRH